MQKKIIALAIAAAMAAPAAAMAEATVYGVVDMSIDMTNDGGDTMSKMGVHDNKRTQISSNQSRIGVKGSEAVGDLTVVYQMEADVAMDTGAAGNQQVLTTSNPTGTLGAWAWDTKGSFFSRNTFVGLAGGFGTVLMGNHDTPYKMATRKLDVFADTIADNRGSMGVNALGVSHDIRVTDALAYVSPDLGGATIAVAYVGETDNSIMPSSWGTVDGATSLSVNYARDNFTVAAANQTINLKTAGAGGQKIADLTATKLGGSFSMDAFSVSLVYETLSSKLGTAGWFGPANAKAEASNLYVGGTYNVTDAGTVKLAYTMIGENKFNGVKGKDGASQLSIGYDHELSKNTSLYAIYTSVANDNNGTHGLFGLSAGATTSATTAAGDPNAMSFGIKHSF